MIMLFSDRVQRMSELTTTIGVPEPRIDGPDKVSGKALYSADIALPNLAWVKVLRSDRPHARIIRIDTSGAKNSPGVCAILTGVDLRGHLTGRRIIDMPILAEHVVRFAGEPVAAVAADDLELAERAINLIRVEYEDLPAVSDFQAAIEDGAPILHPEFNSYQGVKPLPIVSNRFVTADWGTGDMESGFAHADEIIEGTYTTSLVHQGYMETHSLTLDAKEDVHVWASNKAPHYIKEQIAQSIGIEPEKVHIHHVTVGGDFGGKGSPMMGALCYFLSKASGRPVRMVLTYTEELLGANPRHPSTIQVKMGVLRDGRIVACDLDCNFETGAYAGFIPLGFLPGPRHAVGPYHIPNARVRAHHIYTNRVPAGHMRGPGEPQAIFAMESHIDVVAKVLGITPASMRLMNLIRGDKPNGLGERFRDLQGVRTLQAAIKKQRLLQGHRLAEGSLSYGKGMALGERSPGGGKTHAAVTIHPDQQVTVHTSIFEQGSGTYTAIRQIVAESLGWPIKKIQVKVWDTDQTGFDSGAGASRNSRMASEAAHQAAILAKDQLIQRLSHYFNRPSRFIELDGKQLTVRVSDTSGGGVRTRELGPILAGFNENFQSEYRYDDTTHADVTAFTVQIAEVAVDLETGEITILNFLSAHDSGRVINPQGYEGQIRGGVSQGIGYALLEEIEMDQGRVISGSLADYRIPTIADLSGIHPLVIESDSGVGPYGIKGIGENPLSPVAPAIANAIADATGVRIRSLPITAERLLKEIKKSGR